MRECFTSTAEAATALWLAENLYEEVEPVAVLDARLSDAGRELLVKFPDAEEDSWVATLCLHKVILHLILTILPAIIQHRLLENQPADRGNKLFV